MERGITVNIPKVTVTDDLLKFDNRYGLLDPDVGEIENIEQHETTLYVKGSEGSLIYVDIHDVNQIRGLSQYSHLIPTWMKQDFERFLNE